MTGSTAQGSFANRRLALPPVVAVLFVVFAALAFAIVVPSQAYAKADGNQLNVYAGGTVPALSEARECSSAVTVKSGDYVANGLEPDYWTASGLGDTTKLTPDESGAVTFTMPGNDVTLTAHYPTYVTGITVDMNDSFDYSSLENGSPVDVTTVTFTDSTGQKKTVPVTATEASGSRSYFGDVVQSRLFTYTAVVNPSVAKDLGLSVVGSNIQTHVINVSHKDSAVQSANALDVTVLEDDSIKLTAQITVVKEETSWVPMTMKCANVNTKDEITKYDAAVAVGSDFSWDASVLGGVWQFAGWQTPLPDGTSADGSVLTVKGVASATGITAYYKPVVLSVSAEVPELSCGQPFPSTVTSYKVTDVTGEHDITDDVNKDVKLVWTTLDGSPAGNKVRDGVVYRVSITTSKLSSDGYQYATFPIMSNTETSKCVTLNGQTDNVYCVNSEDSRIVTGGEMSAHDGGDFDKIVTTFPKVSVAHAQACEDEAVKTAQYQLKNETVKTADITWDYSGIDDTATSGEFTIKGSYTDVNGGNHEVSQTFALMDLHAPVASPNDIVYEASQQVTLSLDSSFAGVKDPEIWYCVTEFNTKPAASDYKLYTGAFTVGKGDYQVVHTYAKVGQRQTALSEFYYSFVDRYAVKVNGGKAVDAEGNTITSALEGSVVRIVADAPAEGKCFKAWTVTDDIVTIKDAASASTTFCVGSGDVEITATYLTIVYTVSFDTQGGGAVAAQEVEHGAVATTPAAPERAGYVFKGWYTDIDLTQPYDFATPVRSDFNLYAKWEIARNQVTFDSQGGSAVESCQVAYGDAVAEPAAPERDGYFFDGWYTDAAGTAEFSFDTAVTKPLTLYAKWSEKVIITFDAAGGSEASSLVVPKGASVDALPGTERDGYNFEGWYEGAVLIGTDTVFNKSTTLTARWSPQQMRVCFMDGKDVYDTAVVDYDSTLARPADPVRLGYNFEGWYSDEDCTRAYDFREKVRADFNLYAKWSKVNTAIAEGSNDKRSDDEKADTAEPAKPEAASKSESAAKSPAKPKVPESGDAAAAAALPALLGTATVAAAFVSARKKRDE